ncbi:carboxylating nicotinate-nucleotide diphosphorylase [Pueribacillus theae]|uniref:Probable nicotinate-nucleotide pyrophosphorylase [carboxylating] n=1 Tax=Pueribacillus theae TaxID=2171751 RepID=A0A2U1K010_9BACI|nr:carboxylating nicotinate-nucleotide diphosphorylase [Pueribacillus theae]PWA10722.1 carboxylating nicotinate-nucleotide diphosphorylase [Pueribacillus theae]
MNKLLLREKLTQFFMEDIGVRDVTSSSIFKHGEQGSGVIVAKEDGVIAGLSIISEGYHILNPSMETKFHCTDGDRVKKGDVIAQVYGEIADLLSGERVILNLFQRMSGIATKTNEAVQKLRCSHTKVCDTRKTMPGLRMFDKYAVRCGGGDNHRVGLYDGVMLKDNHIAHIGSITKAVQKVREQVGHMVKIEVETESEEEVIEAVQAGADVIMFDNRSPKEIEAFVKLVPKHIITEASGGITVEALSDFRHTGVDYISLGELTHSVKAMDTSLLVEGGKKHENVRTDSE